MDASLLKAYKEVVFSEEDELTERIYPTPKKNVTLHLPLVEERSVLVDVITLYRWSITNHYNCWTVLVHSVLDKPFFFFCGICCFELLFKGCLLNLNHIAPLCTFGVTPPFPTV